MKTIPSAVSGCNPSDGLSPAMQAIHVRLVELIRAAQQASPFEHLGQIWAKPRSLQAWCEIGGFKLRTIKELIKYPPIRRMQCNLPSGKVVLLRVGNPGEERVKATAKRMQAYYIEATKAARLAAVERQKGKAIKEAERAKSKRARSAAIKRAHLVAEEQVALAASETPTVSRAEFGMLCGLARDWPDGWQVEIFKTAIIRWPDFVDDVREQVDAALVLRDMRQSPFHPEILADPLYATARRLWAQRDTLSPRVYRRPFIPFLRAFWPVAWELYVDHRQRYGGGHPERVWQRWSVPRQRTPFRCALSSSRE